MGSVKKRSKASRVSSVKAPKAAKKPAAKAPRASAPERAKAKLPSDLRDLRKLVKMTRNPFDPRGGKRVALIRMNAILDRIQKLWNGADLEEKIIMLRELVAISKLEEAELIAAYVQLGVKRNTLRTEQDVAHVRQDWLQKYFTGPVAKTLVDGSIVAGQRSLQSGLPIAAYWVATAGEELKVAVAESGAQVTFLLMTPPEPGRRTPVRELERPEPLWMVTARDNRVEVEQVFPTALTGG